MILFTVIGYAICLLPFCIEHNAVFTMQASGNTNCLHCKTNVTWNLSIVIYFSLTLKMLFTRQNQSVRQTPFVSTGQIH